MSSATRADVGAARAGLLAGGGVADQAMTGGPGEDTGAALSPRQRALSRAWARYRCAKYDRCTIGWDGKPVVRDDARDAVVSAGYIPPGFYDAGGATLPIEFRRPTVPFYLDRAIVNRFTGLLFSAGRHPTVRVADDPDTDDWLNAVVEQGRLWHAMQQARAFGGAMGSVAISFKFVRGTVRFEVHDPRWCAPEFLDREEGTLLSLEKRYTFRERIRTSQGWVDAEFWYRRVIDDEFDTVWPKVPVRDGAEPDWERCRHTQVPHRLSACPVVWVQNCPVDSELDGDPDTFGAEDLIDRADQLRSQAYRATIANCDPTLQVSTDHELESVRTGSGAALKLEKGGSAGFLEINGSGAEAAEASAARLEARALKLVRCVLDAPGDGPVRTATEVAASYSAMYEQADVLRERYGERGVKRLLSLVVDAARALERPVLVARDGRQVAERQVVRLPPKEIRDPETGEVTGRMPRVLGRGEQVELVWPSFDTPTGDDTGKAVAAAGQAKAFGLLDLEHCVRHIAPFFKVENVQQLVAKLANEAQAAQAMMDDQLAARGDDGEDSANRTDSVDSTGDDADDGYSDFGGEEDGDG